MIAFLKDITILAAILLLIAVVIGWITVLTPQDADNGPAPLTAILEGGRV